MTTAQRSTSLGPRLGRFEIHRLVVVSGDRGAVFLAVDTSSAITEKYALTALDTRRMEQRERDAFFERWSASASLNLPALVPPIDHGGRRGVLYVVTEWLDGVDLEQLVGRHLVAEGVPLGLRQVVTIGAELGETLGAIHEARDVDGSPRRLVHGRVALTRVFMTRSGGLRLLGFPGTPQNMVLARAPIDAKAFGFLAPEQLRGELPDVTTDVYALALLILSARLGRNPLERPTLADTEAAILAGVRWDGLDVEPVLREVLEDSLSLDPSERPRSARQLASRLLHLGVGATLLNSDWRALVEGDFPRTQSVAHEISEEAAELAKFLMEEIRAAEPPPEVDEAPEPEPLSEEAPRDQWTPASTPTVPPHASHHSSLGGGALVLFALAALVVFGGLAGLSGRSSGSPERASEPPPIASAHAQAAAYLDGAESALARHDAVLASALLSQAEAAGLPFSDLQVRHASLRAACAQVHDRYAAPVNLAAVEDGAAGAPAVATGTLDVTSEPPGVVYVDGEPIGTAPVTGQRLPIGTHTVDVRLEGHTPEHREVDVASEPPVHLSFRLHPS